MIYAHTALKKAEQIPFVSHRARGWNENYGKNKKRRETL